jgi:hypothetical protein
MTDEQIAAIAEAGAREFAQDVYGRAGFDHVMDEAGYYAAEEPADGNVYVEEIHPEWVKIARGIVEATLKAERP